jgi:hypothetical protein
MNKHKVKDIFVQMAKVVAADWDSQASGGKAAVGPALVARGNVWLPGRASEAYLDALDAITDITGTWSRESVDAVLWEHIEGVLQTSSEERATVIAVQANEIVRRFAQELSDWTVDVLVYGVDVGCAGLSFGGLTFLSEEVSVSDLSRQVFAEILGRPQVFARLVSAAVDKESAIHRAGKLVDRHFAVLNSLCALGRPSLVRAARVNHIGRTHAIHRVGKSAETMGPMGGGATTSRLRLMRDRLESLLALRVGQRVSGMLSSPENEFSVRVLRGYELAGTACVDPHPERRFLTFAIALESVILGKDTSSELIHQLATRVAHLIGNGSSGRKHIVHWVKKLYDRRSKIVHTGEYGVSRTESGLIQLYCMSVLGNLVQSPVFDGFTSNEHLEAWFRERTLEGPSGLSQRVR